MRTLRHFNVSTIYGEQDLEALNYSTLSHLSSSERDLFSRMQPLLDLLNLVNAISIQKVIFKKLN